MESYLSDAQRLQAVQRRDARADGYFVYAVLTTGVMCYPSCPSRAALPENMRFYKNVAEAQAAGFRHCKRCRTDLPPLTDRNRQLVVQACRHIEASECVVRIESLATVFGVSRFHLLKLFKHYIGLSPKAYAQAIRAEKLRDTLDADHTITQTLHGAGYDSIGSFYADVQKRLGMSASSLRKGSPQQLIHYGFADTPLGLIVVAQTENGVCALLFGDTPTALKQELVRRFPHATLRHDKQFMQEKIALVVETITAPALVNNIPLDIQGTVFQEKVWQALRKIEPGQTASYADVAQAIGQPKAARAVATACAANPVAVLVPCHRVVRGDGAVSGYRWGVERKRALLDTESENASITAG